jgi:hypothetical protein
MAGILSVVVLPVLMGEAASAPADTRAPLSARLGSDRGILRLFAVLVGISVIASVVSSLSADGVDLYDFASSVLGGLIVSFTIVGVPAYFQHWRTRLTPRRSVRRWVVAVSVVITATLIIFIVWAAVYAPELVRFDGASTPVFVLGMVLVVVVRFMVSFIMCTMSLLVAFGVVGVLLTLERRHTAWALRLIARLCR